MFLCDDLPFHISRCSKQFYLHVVETETDSVKKGGIFLLLLVFTLQTLHLLPLKVRDASSWIIVKMQIQGCFGQKHEY